VLGGWAGALAARLGERLLADLREEVVDRALAVPQADLEAAGTGDLLARVGGDVDAISESFPDAVPALLVSGLTIALTGVGLLYLDWRLVLAACLALPVHVVSARRYLRESRPLFAAERVALGVQTQRLHDALAGARAIRARRERDEVEEKVARASSDAVARAVGAGRRGSSYAAQLNGAELVAMAGVLTAGFVLVRADAITVGAATRPVVAQTSPTPLRNCWATTASSWPSSVISRFIAIIVLVVSLRLTLSTIRMKSAPPRLSSLSSSITRATCWKPKTFSVSSSTL
jgi:ATP-binding cassette subfamily C protein